MKVARTPVVLGTLATLGGLLLLAQGWDAALGGDLGGAAALRLGAGAALAVLGVVMVAVPLAAPLLFRLYGPQAFSSRGACPVVARCGRCQEFNFRGRPTCKACGAAVLAEPPAA